MQAPLCAARQPAKQPNPVTTTNLITLTALRCARMCAYSSNMRVSRSSMQVPLCAAAALQPVSQPASQPAT
jgi:hypothetical protein